LTDVGHSPEGYDGDVSGSSAIQAGHVLRIPDVAEQFSFHCGLGIRFEPGCEERLSLMMLIKLAPNHWRQPTGRARR
jgi:hypothetical protein